MRLFYAIPLPPALLPSLAAFQAKLAHTRANVRWTPPPLFHITVKFLGETPDHLVPQLAARLDHAAAEVPPFPLVLDGIDRFPPRGPARVIVVPIQSPDQRLTKLHRLLDSAAAGLGLPLDTRPLNPHLTLGRVNNNHNLNKLLRLIAKHAYDPLGSFTADTVTLLHSTPTPQGPQHTPLHTTHLTPTPAAP